jgi:hypothetical protein
MREPTAEECNDHRPVVLDSERTGLACWYPQMGGYVGKAVVVLDNDCVNVYVWHDGHFPFGDEDDRSPAELHHCDGEQFVRFGEFLMSMQGMSTPFKPPRNAP